MKIIKLVKYQLNIYFRGIGFVMPFLSVIVFLYMMYSMQPLDVISGFLTSGIILFLIMVWVGIATGQQEDDVMEQILIFKMNSAAAYYIGKLLFLVTIALLFTLLCIFVPVAQNLVNGGDMFERKLVAGDIISALFIISSSAICGAFFGNFFHPRFMKNRKLAYFIVVFFCVLIIAKPAIIEEIPLLRYPLWLLPSIMYPSELYARAEYFNVLESMKIGLAFILYANVYGGLKSFLCHKYRF